jgi:Spy/CpxP family protein refolding chaperone
MKDQHSDSALSRRSLLSSAAAAAATAPSLAKAAESPKKFKLKYAPSLGSQFQEHAGKDPIDQLNLSRLRRGLCFAASVLIASLDRP